MPISLRSYTASFAAEPIALCFFPHSAVLKYALRQRNLKTQASAHVAHRIPLGFSSTPLAAVLIAHCTWFLSTILVTESEVKGKDSEVET